MSNLANVSHGIEGFLVKHTATVLFVGVISFICTLTAVVYGIIRLSEVT